MQLKRIYFILFVIIIFDNNSYCQTDSIVNLIEQLERKVLNTKNTNEKGALQFQLANNYYLTGNYNKAIENAQTSIFNTTDTSTILNNNLLLAYIYIDNNEDIKALQYYLKATKICEKKKCNKILIDVHSQIGLVYLKYEAYQKAIEYFIQSKNIAEIEKNNTKKYENISKIAYCYKKMGDNKNSILYYEQLLRYYIKTSNKVEWIKVQNHLIDIYKKQKKYALVLKHYNQLYDSMRNDAKIVELANIKNNIAYCYVNLNNYDTALVHFKHTLLLDEQLNSPSEKIATTKRNIAICYQNIGNYEACLINLIDALEINEENKNFEQQSELENLIALIYLKMDDLYNAENYSLKSIDNAQISSNPKQLDECYRTYAQILQNKGEYEKALLYYQKHLSIRDSLMVEKKLSEQQKQVEIEKLQKAEKKQIEKIIEDELTEMEKVQIKLEKEKKEKELEVLRKNTEIAEMEEQRAKQALQLAKQQHEAQLKEQQILALEQEKTLKDLELQKKEAEEKKKQKEIELLETEREKQKLQLDKQAEERKRMQWVISLFGLIFILILIGFILVRKKNRVLAKQKLEIEIINTDLTQKNEEISSQKEHLQMANEEILSINEELEIQKEEIIEQKSLIENKNKSITDSILYAKRIQQAIFPPADFLAAYNIQHFIYFKPRDIVSGDFFWFHKDDNYLFMTAADCTGHGVPGAFMSMLGISLLNKIVGEHEIYQPSLILNELRRQVKSSLHQNSKTAYQSKDGMDISFCRLDLNTNELQYAGANNPLYIIREEKNVNKFKNISENILTDNKNNNLHLIEFKPDRMPIGIYIKEKESFTNYTVNIQKNDRIYLFSDGYIDQFGGKKGRKFLARTFKKLLLSMYDIHFEKQSEILEKTYQNWINDKYRQLDDIIIIGFKLQ